MTRRVVPHVLAPSLREALSRDFSNYNASYIHSTLHGELRIIQMAGSCMGKDIWNDDIDRPKTVAYRANGRDRMIKGNGAGWLSTHARGLDVAAVYELIRLGHPVDLTDPKGSTALLDVCLSLHAAASNSSSKVSYRTDHKAYIRIIGLLILHHADVNIVIGGRCPLALMAEANQWDLVELLLQHGARPKTQDDRPISQTLIPSQRLKLDRLAKLHYSDKRPARLCICHSGLPLDECHNSPQAQRKEVPWPSYALCPCPKQLDKTYADCCEKWGGHYMYWRDGYLTMDCRMPLQVHQKYKATFPPEMRPLLDAMKLQGEPTPPPAQSGSRELRGLKVSAVASKLLQLRAVDPAYAAVLTKYRYDVHPLEDSEPKRDLVTDYKKWNQLASEYMALGIDARSHRELEIACKVGINGGPFYRLCESVYCQRREMSEGEYKQCSKCKKTVYCSRECQTESWKEHKPICGSPQQTHQWSRDQRLVQDLINEMDRRLAEDTQTVASSLPVNEELAEAVELA